MKIRVEFGPSKSSSYAFAVHLAEKHRTHKIIVKHGITIHAVEFDNIEDWKQLHHCIGGWCNAAQWLNGRSVADDDLWEIWDKKHPPNHSLVDVAGASVPARSVINAEVITPHALRLDRKAKK